jgi:hypothetical protein
VGVARPGLKQSIFMEMKPSQFSLGRHSFSDAPYWNPDMVIREQGPGRHRLSDALHRRPDVVSNEQGFSHLTRRVRGARKLVGESRICLGSWNVGSLTGKLRDLILRLVGALISYVFRRLNGRVRRLRRWRIQALNCSTREKNEVEMV